MKKICFCFFVILLFFSQSTVFASDTLYIKVHFLYGSKPKKEYKETEKTWFGGIHGGHVGIEYEHDKIIDFVPSGKFHYIAKKEELHSSFAHHTEHSFWSIFGGDPDKVKKATFVIPISKQQKEKLDSIVKVYSNETPYDYAFIGMRCGAAAYEILGQLGIVKSYPIRKTYRKIFYPKKLRKRLFKLSERKKWDVITTSGYTNRKWEKD